MKKICSVVLALLLVLSMAPLSVMAGNSLPSVGYLPYQYVVSDDQTVIITWFKGETDATAVVPATIADRPVVAIDNGAFSGCAQLMSVELPDTVTTIEANAFLNCSKLNSVTMSGNVSYIGDGAFMNCDLHQFAIPESLTVIRPNTFAGNANLVNMEIPAHVTEIGDGAFANCTYLTTLRMEEGVQTFGNGVFSGCGNLQKVTLPASLTAAGENLFDGCTGLKTINVFASEKPAGWNDNWLGDCTATVRWGYMPEHSTLGHKGMRRVFGLEPTCTTEGIIAHFLCQTCNRTFQDRAGTIELTDVTLPSTGHIHEETFNCEQGWTCMVCGVHGGVTEHLAGDWMVTEQATCTEAGERTKSCTKCGAVLETETIPAKGHTPGAAADCTTDQTCTVCGDVIEAAKGHTAGEWNITKQATCTETGEQMKTCAVCGVTVATEMIPAKGHTPGAAADCTTDQTCTVCNAVINAATGHTAGEWNITKQATCTEAGEKTRSCTVCGTFLATATIPAKGHTPGDVADCTHSWTCTACGLELEPAPGHTAGAWTVTKEATCTEAGEMTRFCTVCGMTVNTIVLPAKGHIAGDWTITKQATCTEAGERVKSCTGCDIVVEIETVPVAEHTVGDWVTNQSATCTEAGFKTKSCTVCGAVTEVQILSAKGHAPGVEATCTEAQTCTACGAILNSAKGHTESDWTVAEQATCTGTGEKIRTCTECGKTVATEVIPAKGHAPGAEATCTKAQTCTACGVILNPAKGHTIGDWTVAKEATCTGFGEQVKTCTECGKVVATEIIPAKGHTPGAEATCTKPQTCTACGAILNAAKGHTESDWTVTKEPTHMQTGERIKTCTECGVVLKVEVIPVLPAYQTYTVGDQVVISEYLGAESNVIVPTEIDGHSVSAIGASAYQGCDFLEEVTLPETVLTIESKAFANCTSLTSVTIPASVETIGKGAFDGCTNLTDIYFETSSLPEGVDEQWLEGCQATVHFLGETAPQATLKGDLNGDGELTAADYLKARRAFFGLSPLNEEELALIDFDGNGQVDAAECMMLKRAIYGLGDL